MSEKKDLEETDPLRKSILHYQTRHVIYNIYTFLKIRKLDPTTFEHVNDINLVNTISDMTGLSRSSVTRTIRKGNTMKLESKKISFKPQEDKKHIRKKRIAVDKTTEGTIRRKVIQYYNLVNEVPSIRKLNSILKEEKILQCSNEYLRQLLHKLGFTNSEKHSDVLKEREDLVARRLSYLQAMKQYRAQNKSIFFFNDTSCWADYEDAHYNMNTLPTFIVVHFSGSIGFTDSQIVKMKCKSTNHNKSFKHFVIYDWVKDSILPKMPDESVVVINTPNSEPGESEEKLSTASTRGEMQVWLSRHFIPFKETDTKEKLYQKVVHHRERMESSIEKLLKDHFHEVLYLPGNVPDLNPTLLVWDNMKGYTENTLPKTLFSEYSPEKWHKCFEEVKDNEQEYYYHDMKMDEAEPMCDLSVIQEIKKEEFDVEVEIDIDDSKKSNTDSMDWKM